MIAKPSLLLLTALATSAAAVAAGVEVADPGPADKTRLGVEIAGDMSARDLEAAKRKRALDLREQAARAAEKRMKAELQPAAAASGAAATPAPPGTSPLDESYASLAKIYQAMKPAAAAVVFEQLDMDVQMKVAALMRDRATGMILAAMTPRGAAALTMAIARQKASAGRAMIQASAPPPLATTPPAAPAVAPPMR